MPHCCGKFKIRRTGGGCYSTKRMPQIMKTQVFDTKALKSFFPGFSNRNFLSKSPLTRENKWDIRITLIKKTLQMFKSWTYKRNRTGISALGFIKRYYSRFKIYPIPSKAQALVLSQPCGNAKHYYRQKQTVFAFCAFYEKLFALFFAQNTVSALRLSKFFHAEHRIRQKPTALFDAIAQHSGKRSKVSIRCRLCAPRTFGINLL